MSLAFMVALPPGVAPGQPIPSHVFHKLPRLPGWRYETHEGVLHVRPDGSVQVVRIGADAAPSGMLRAAGGPPIRLAPWSDVAPEALLDLLDEAFGDSVHYWGWPDHDRRDSLSNELGAERGVGSVVAVTEAGRPAGALLTARGSGGPFINVLGVGPAHRRRGIAGAMLAAALLDVRAAGHDYLFSSYLLASVDSALWHYALGFDDLPTAAATASRLRAVRWDLARTPAVSENLLAAALEALRAAEARLGAPEDALSLATRT